MRDDDDDCDTCCDLFPILSHERSALFLKKKTKLREKIDDDLERKKIIRKLCVRQPKKIRSNIFSLMLSRW